MWKGKSMVLTSSLADALHDNTGLTKLSLSLCNIGDGALTKLADAIQFNATLSSTSTSRADAPVETASRRTRASSTST